jgi:hypothetical protein
MDPYAGNQQDPQSLHKYLYCHANPVNRIDPTGHMGALAWVGIGILCVVISILLMAALMSWVGNISYKSALKNIDSYIWGGLFLDVKIDGRWKQMTPNGILKKYKVHLETVARAEGVPPDLVAGVLYTEMQHYAFHDLLGDDFGYGSLGPAQMKVKNVKRWLPGEVGSKTDAEVRDMLLDPKSAITLLTKCIKIEFSYRWGVVDEFRRTRNKDNRARLCGDMASIKDNGVRSPDSYHWYSQDFAPKMYNGALKVLWGGNIPQE